MNHWIWGCPANQLASLWFWVSDCAQNAFGHFKRRNQMTSTLPLSWTAAIIQVTLPLTIRFLRCNFSPWTAPEVLRPSEFQQQSMREFCSFGQHRERQSGTVLNPEAMDPCAKSSHVASIGPSRSQGWPKMRCGHMPWLRGELPPRHANPVSFNNVINCCHLWHFTR